MVNITFYFKDGCWLCEHAQEMLNGIFTDGNVGALADRLLNDCGPQALGSEEVPF